MNQKTRKAVSLISGGLDSLLATKIILEQGVEVCGINFFTGFSGDHDHCFNKRCGSGRHGAKWVADRLGIKLHVIDVVDDFKPVLLCPKYGYGANINPCLDCKLFMIMQAKKWMEDHGYDFLITGEVLGQRPMSQRKDTLPIASKITSDLIVRPLCAKALESTIPEREGWIDRDKLYDISGRGRERQIELAHHFGFDEFPQPGGGCTLTDANFCGRLQDLFDHREDQNYSRDDVLLLNVGRHLRINPDLKIIVGRDEVENNFIETYADKNILLQASNHPGALVLIDGCVNKDDLILGARIASYFSKGRNERDIKVLARHPQEGEEALVVDPLQDDDLRKWYV